MKDVDNYISYWIDIFVFDPFMQEASGLLKIIFSYIDNFTLRAGRS